MTRIAALDSIKTASGIPGAVRSFAGRIGEPDRFAMSGGVVVPVYREMIEEVALDMLAQRRGDPERVSQYPRFAIAIYRAAIGRGIMNNVVDE